MANLIKNFLGYLKLGDDDYEEDYDTYEDENNRAREQEERRAREEEEPRSRRSSSRTGRRASSVEESASDYPEYHSQRVTRLSRESEYNRSEPASDRVLSRQSTTRARREEQPEPRRRSGESRFERTTNNKVVPIRTTSSGMEVCIIKPTAFEDSQDICDMLLNGRAAIVNLEGINAEEAQRIIDFVCGTIYAINGKLHAVARYIFIFSPNNVDISGDYAQFFQEEGFGVPKFNRDF